MYIKENELPILVKMAHAVFEIKHSLTDNEMIDFLKECQKVNDRNCCWLCYQLGKQFKTDIEDELKAIYMHKRKGKENNE